MTVRLMVDVCMSVCDPLVAVAVTVMVEVPAGVPVTVLDFGVLLLLLHPPMASEAPRARATASARHLRLRRTASKGRLSRPTRAAPIAL